MRSLDRCKRVLYLNKLCFRPFIIILQPLLLLVIRHQNDASFMTFIVTCCPVSKPAARSHLPERMIFGVDLSKTLGRYPTINERSVPDWSVSGVECESAIINSLIVGEVRRFCCVPAHRSVASRGGLGGLQYGSE